MANRESYFSYWGKRDSERNHHLLIYHCLDAAAAGQCLVERDPRLQSLFLGSPLFSENKGLLSFLLALHDLGKFSAGFQEKIQFERDTGANHPLDSLIFILHKIKPDSELYSSIFNNSKEFAKYFSILSKSVSGHHGKPVFDDFRSSLCRFGEENADAASSFVRDIGRLFLPDFTFDSAVSASRKKEIKQQTIMLSWVLAGLCVTSDWIASNEEYFPWKKEAIPLEEYWRLSYSRAKEILPRLGLIPSPTSGLATISELFGYLPRPLQKIIEGLPISKGPNLYILEESTGGGKTEAALVLAKRLMDGGCGDGFYFALPTMATANAMYERIAGDTRLYEKFYSGDLPVSVVLAHGQPLLSKRYQDFIGQYGCVQSSERWMYDSRKKALLSSIGVGTIDQALMGVLPFKHQCLRLYGCCRNILIVDEVHAYDAYMNNLLLKLLQFHKSCGGSVILLSATLPRALKEAFTGVYSSGGLSSASSAYPLVTSADAEGTICEIPVPPSPDKKVFVRLSDTEADVADELVRCALSGGCACWIRNTVSDAISAFRMLKGKEGISVSLFHARFVLGDRLEREKDVLQWFGKSSDAGIRRGRVLIATQVVEQSLDLDFDFLVSDLAPVDLIIQRAGRLWRHERGRPSPVTRPEMLILSPAPVSDADADWYFSMFPGGGYVYPDHGKLWKTTKVLLERGEFSMPRDARYLIDYVYGNDGVIPPELIKRESEANREKKCSDAHADTVSLNLKKGYGGEAGVWVSEEPALTREGEQNVSLELWKDSEGGRSLWCSGCSHADMLSRVTISLKKYKNYFPETVAEKSSDENAVRVYLHTSGGVWVSDISENIYYSSEEGFVFLTTM